MSVFEITLGRHHRRCGQCPLWVISGHRTTVPYALGLTQFACGLSRGPIDAGHQPRSEFWIGCEVKVETSQQVENARDHEISHTPLVSSKESVTRQFLLKYYK